MSKNLRRTRMAAEQKLGRCLLALALAWGVTGAMAPVRVSAYADELEEAGQPVASEPIDEDEAGEAVVSEDAFAPDTIDSDEQEGAFDAELGDAESAESEPATEEESEEPEDIELSEVAEEVSYDIEWYLEQPDADSYLIANADELRGLSALVNGTAVDDEGNPIEAQDFAGRYFVQLASFDLSAGSEEGIEFTPIGSPEHPFAGVYDGANNAIGGLSITQTTSYAGLFGCVSSAGQLKNIVLSADSNAGILVETDSEIVQCVGALAGKVDGPVSNCYTSVPVSIISYTEATVTTPYVVRNAGGLLGYARADVSRCGSYGSLNVQIYSATAAGDTTSNSLRVGDSFGGLIGRFGDPNLHGTLTDSFNEGSVTVQTYGAGAEDRFGTTTNANTFFVGGVVGYSNGSIYRCHNGSYNELYMTTTGNVFTGVYGEDGVLLGGRGADQAGGICGSLRGESDDPDKYNDGDPYDPMVLADCYNEGQVTALNATGGICGQTGVYCTIARCYNGTITDLSDWTRNQLAGKVVTTRWNKPLSGGVVGQTRSGVVAYCANYAEVRNIQTGYYMAGIAGCIFTSDDYPGVTGEIYACLNTGGIYTINESKSVEYREAGICGDNEGYVHDCIMLEGSVPYHSDSAIGNMDWGVTSNLFVKSAADLQTAESAALLNAVAAQTQDWDCYWFVNRAGYPILNTWANLVDEDRIELTADAIASVQQLEAAPYVGEGAASLPTLRITLTDGTVLVQNTDFYVIPQEGAYEMTDSASYLASIQGIGLYRGFVQDCAAYSIGRSSLASANVFIGAQKYNFGKAVYPATVEARINGNTITSSEFDYIIYSAQTSTANVQSKRNAFAVFDSAGYISYDREGTVLLPVSEVGVEAINAETRDWWMWSRDGELMSDSTGKVYYTSASGGTPGVVHNASGNCINLKSGTPAGYVVELTARSSSMVLSDSAIGYYVIEPVNLYQECVFESAEWDGATWYWDAEAFQFYMLDEQGERLEGVPSATFIGETIQPTVTMRYGEYQLVEGKDYRIVPGDPDPSEEDVLIGDGPANRNITTAGTVRAAITIRPVNTSNMSNYVIAFFEIAPADFADCEIVLERGEWAYTGEGIVPDVKVMLNGVQLEAGIDYEIEFENNVERGTASYTVTPLDNLSAGSMAPYEGTFEIVDGTDLSTLSIAPIENQQFNWGYDVHPALTFLDAEGQQVQLEEGIDYTVSYSQATINKWPDTTIASKEPCTVTVVGKGAYTGTVTATFDIVPYDATFNATDQLRALTQTLKYGQWGEPAQSTKTVTVDGEEVLIDRIANVGVNYPILTVLAYPIVDWAAYDAGDTASCFGDPIVLSTSNNNVNGGLVNRYPVHYFDALDQEVSGTGYAYTDSSNPPQVIAAPQMAVPGAMTAQISFRCGTGGNRGGATGTLAVPFMYEGSADLSLMSWAAGSQAQRTYDGEAKTPVVATMAGPGIALTEGTDYAITYENNVNAGIASYTATALPGSYFSGTHSGSFTIFQADLEQLAQIAPIPTQALAEGQDAVEPSPVVSIGETVLAEGDDYTVSYASNHAVGTGMVYVMGCGNYTGRLGAEFAIEEAPEGFVITQQPNDCEAAVNQTARFTMACDDPAAAYQWQASSDDGATWADSGLTGAKTALLSFKVTAARAAKTYRCVVSFSDGSIAVSEVVRVVEPAQALAILQQPSDSSVVIGKTAKFSIATNDSGATYRWQTSGDGGATWTNSGLTGAKTTAFSFKATAARASKLYRCMVTFSDGSTVASDVARVVAPDVVYAVTKWPVDCGSVVNATASFVMMTDDYTASYQWQVSSDDGATWVDTGLTGATTSKLSFKVTAARATKSYRCVVTFSNGTTAVSDAVRVVAPAIIAQPQDVTAAVGSTAMFAVASNDPAASYQWQVSSDGGATWADTGLTGATTDTLSFKVTAARAAKAYRCVVTFVDGSIEATEIAHVL